MDFVKSALYLEVQNVVRSGREPTGVQVDVEFHLSNTEIFKPLVFLSRDIDQNFVLNYGDIVFITVLMTKADYAYKIYPNRTNLYVTLTDRAVGIIDRSPIASAYGFSEKYKAILLDENGNPIVEHDGRNSPDEVQLEASGFVEVTFQLLSEALNLLRMFSASKTYHNVSGDKILKTVFSSIFDKLPIDDAVRPYGVDVVPIDNREVYRQIVVPQQIMLPNLADYLQNKAGGLYSSGLGNYYLRRHWRIFPIFNTDRQEETDESITLVLVPEKLIPGIEKTYIRSGKHTTILATGDVKFSDESDKIQLNSGNAVRFADANNFIDGRMSVDNNKALYKRNLIASEVVTATRGDRLNLAPFVGITANPFAEYSKMAQRDGAIVALKWEYSNIAILKPGMVVKLMYLDGDNIRTLNGCLIGAQHNTYTKDKGATNTSRFHTNSALAVFVNRRKAYL